jgi:tetratricopeptide (TPR) repeat protein
MRHPGTLAAYRPLLRVLATGTVLTVAWLAAQTEVQRVRLFQTMGSEVQALLHCRMAAALALQHQTVQASEHYGEAVRLAERACKVTAYREPMLLGTLAFTYGQAGRFDEAVATARKGRDLALASGQNELAERLLKLMEGYSALGPARTPQ